MVELEVKTLNTEATERRGTEWAQERLYEHVAGKLSTEELAAVIVGASLFLTAVAKAGGIDQETLTRLVVNHMKTVHIVHLKKAIGDA